MKYILLLIMMVGFNYSFAQDPEYTYIDGNGNKYELYGNQMHYAPVKKENSSSGEYSGGVPGEFDLESSTVKKIKSLISKAVKEEADHIEHREMGSGMIVIKEKKGDKIIILKMNSVVKTNLEDYLKSLVNS